MNENPLALLLATFSTKPAFQNSHNEHGRKQSKKDSKKNKRGNHANTGQDIRNILEKTVFKDKCTVKRPAAEVNLCSNKRKVTELQESPKKLKSEHAADSRGGQSLPIVAKDIQIEDNMYKQHFQCILTTSVADQVKDHCNWLDIFDTWNTLGRIKLERPIVSLQKSPSPEAAPTDHKCDNIPGICKLLQKPKPGFQLGDLRLCHQVASALKKYNKLKKHGFQLSQSGFTSLQNELVSVLSNYVDVYYPEFTVEKWKEVRIAYCLHILNHIFRGLELIGRNDTLLYVDPTYSESIRDQGLVKTKVLIVVPFKNTALCVVRVLYEAMCFILDQRIATIKNAFPKFWKNFRPGEESERKPSKRSDFNVMFEGNIDDDFLIGLKVSSEKNIQIVQSHSALTDSDVIVASPLGLRTKIEKPGPERDFLSSVEILILEQADVFLMQNWEHITLLMEAVNNPPYDVKNISTPLDRVHSFLLDEIGSHYRQTIVLATTYIDHNKAVVSKCTNFAGRFQVLNPVEKGSVQQVIVPCEMAIHRIPGVNDPDERFTYFIKNILPDLRCEQYCHTLIYVPDYCDYLRLRLYLRREGGCKTVPVDEYRIKSKSTLKKPIKLFRLGQIPILLYTERYHFYTRGYMRGVHHVVFYGPPSFPQFFPEVCNFMVDGNLLQSEVERCLGTSPHMVTLLVQDSDAGKLAGIVRAKRMATVIKSDMNIHICSVAKQ